MYVTVYAKMCVCKDVCVHELTYYNLTKLSR